MEIANSRIGDSFNVGGELFPKISADRKTAAAFYTTSTAAEFLAGLTIRESDYDGWSDVNIFKKLKIADLTCGTGTLLRHAYLRIRMFGVAKGWDHEQVAKCHVDAMQGGLIGTDVSPIAAHLTNSSLTLAGGGLPYSHTRIGCVEAGKSGIIGRGLSTGSLEFLAESTVSNSLFGDHTAGETSGNQNGQAITVEDTSIDYIIMNPPYSRTHGGQSAFDIAGMTNEQRDECQKRWGYLIRNIPANKTAGMAASFLCLAGQKIRDGGRIGFVLPLSFAFDKSWSKTRAMIIHDFEDIIALPSTGEFGSAAFSADTGMGEMILVATKRKRNGICQEPAEVNCVNLYHSPSRQGEASEFARAILAELHNMQGDTRPVFVGEQALGKLVRFQPTRPEDPWTPLGSLQDALSLDVQQLATNGDLTGLAFRCPMTRLDDLFEVGPTHDLIGHPSGGDERGAFRWTKLPRDNEMVRYLAIWSANAQTQQQIRCQATQHSEVWNHEKAAEIAE